MNLRRLLLALASAALLTTTINAAELSAADLDKRRKALDDLIKERWEYGLKTSPEFASYLGDKRYNDQVSDVSEAEVQRELAVTKRDLARIRKIDTSGFSEQERLNKVLMEQDLQHDVEDSWTHGYEMPVTQMGGIHLNAATFPSYLSFTNVKDYDDFAKRMRAFPKQIDDTIANMRKGMADKLMPPKFLLEKVAGQVDELAANTAEKSPWFAPTNKFPDSVPEGERARIRADYVDAINTSMLPSYRKFAKFVRDEYVPKGRTNVGVWSLPEGARRYATRVKRSTTTNLTPEEIHEIGLREVQRIEGDMLAIAKSQGYNDLKSFNAAVEKNPDLRPKTSDDIVNAYRKYEDQMYAELPKLFGRLPKAKLTVVAMEDFRAKNAAGADYDTGAADGSRPGRVNVNTTKPSEHKNISFESTAYHEGVPGHHMQLSIAQELPTLPEFRRNGGYTAYVEGWALYSERLGKEVGFYQNPFNDYGRLQDEMLRAIRLVVDTGLHSKKWTREQVVQFFHDHSAIDEFDVQNETDRYIVWPGQALGYKIGQLKILELRDRAKRELGDRFDIRAFHDEVLGAGALPMDVLEQRINDWIATQKKG
jgi:uncharacterized protein (DUF885 family)